MYKAKIFPIIVPVINKLADIHWHKLLQDSLGALKNILKDIDNALYDKTVQSKDNNYMYLVKTPDELSKDREKPDEKWNQLEKKAKSFFPNLTLVIPYSASHIVGENNGLDNGNCPVIE